MIEPGQASAEVSKASAHDETARPASAGFDYDHLPGFEDLYLEGSFVLAIQEAPGLVSFALNAALRPTHPWYEARPMDAHSFFRVEIVFSSVRSVSWHARRQLAYKDADGRTDRGTLDVFIADGNGAYVLEGDWGAVSIESAAPSVRQVSPEPDSRATRRRRLESWLAGK